MAAPLAMVMNLPAVFSMPGFNTIKAKILHDLYDVRIFSTYFIYAPGYIYLLFIFSSPDIICLETLLHA